MELIAVCIKTEGQLELMIGYFWMVFMNLPPSPRATAAAAAAARSCAAIRDTCSHEHAIKLCLIKRQKPEFYKLNFRRLMRYKILIH